MEHRGHNHLSRIPDDVLWEICHQVALCEIKHTYQARRSLTLVSRRLNSIATPILYRYLGVYCGSPRGFGHPASEEALHLASKISVMRIHRKLRSTTTRSLGQYCQSLELTLNRGYRKVTSIELMMAIDILSWLPNVNCLSLRGYTGYHNLSEMLEAAVQHMPLLREFTYVPGTEGDSAMLNAIQRSKFNLRTMRLLPFGREQFPDSDAELHPVRSCPAKALHIVHYRGSMDYLRYLVQNFHGLEHFNFSDHHYDKIPIDLDMLSSMLSAHRSTLKSIRLENQEFIANTKLDVSEFGRLEALHLSRWSLINLDFSSETGRMLLPPLLKFLRLDFSVNHSASSTRHERWASLNASFEQWIKDLADYAARTNSALSAIYIKYSPKADMYTADTVDVANGYPWDRMKRMRAHLKRLGIRLGYPSPSMTKIQWSDYIKVVDEGCSCCGGHDDSDIDLLFS